MSEKRNWDQDFPKTPESFKLALKQQVEKEMVNENDRSEDIKKMVEINPSNTKKKRRKWVKIAVAAVALIGLMSGGVYAVTKSGVSALVGREVNEAEGESYLTTDMSTFNQRVIPGWPQTMIDIFGEERAAEVKGISEPLLTITQVYYDGLSLAFYARPTKAGRKYELGADRLVIGDAVYMIEFDQLPTNVAENRDGVEKGDYKGTVQLGGREVSDHFTAELVLGAGKHGTQTVSFDVQIDKNAIVKQKQTVEVSDMRQYEYMNHVKTFVTNWYAFDESSYEKNISLALNLIGNKGKEMLNEYNDVNMLNSLIQKNIRYGVRIKDIEINTHTIPVSGKITFTQTGYRARGSISREIEAEFTIYDMLSRSEENAHGAKIEDWIVRYSEPVESDGTSPIETISGERNENLSESSNKNNHGSK